MPIRQELLLGASLRPNSHTKMLSDVAVMFAARGESMAVRSKVEPWSHHDELSLVTEAGSPTAISTTFWDQLIPTKASSNDLFDITTPHVDRSLKPSTPSFQSYGVRDTSQGSDSTGSCLYSDQHGDRYKRRRMLQFSDGSAGGYAQNSPLPYENVISSPSTTYSYSSYSSSCADSSLSSVCSGSDCMLQPYDSPTFPTSSWFSGSYNSSFMLPNAQQSVDKWTSSFDSNQSYSALVQMKSQVQPLNSYIPTSLEEIFSPQAWKRPSPPTPQSNFSLHQHTPSQMLYQQSFPQVQMKQEYGLLQSPPTPFSKPPIPPGQMKPSSGPSRFKTKLPIPVALPFAMLKPSAAQGDVTLNDINKRLLSPPPTPGDINPFSLLNEKKPPTLAGAGLSGKSVVTCTKIHTEGAGTITIMRTKG